MKHKGIVGLTLFSITALSFIGFNTFKAEKPVVVAFAYTNGDAATYYSSITGSENPSQLIQALRSLNNSKRQYLPGYDGMRSKFTTTDPGTSSGSVTSFYSGRSITSNITREHVWPFSKLVINTGNRGQNDIEKDMHMIRPSASSENSSRGNSFYVEGMKDSSLGWDPAMETWGDATYRGDAARIIFYCVIADSGLSLVDKSDDYNSNHTMGKLSDLLKWNLQYPVKARENTRNEAVEKIQGNRNPFIDHPEYACRIWGNTNSTTKSICQGSTTEGISIRNGADNSEMPAVNEMAVTDEVTLVPYYNGQLVTDASKVTWSLIQYSNSNPYTGNAVVKTAYNTTGIRLTVNTDVSFGVKLQYQDGTQARIKFKFGNGSVDPGGGGNKPKKGCGGSIVTTSAVLSALSLAGLSILLIKRKKEKSK